jgi:hypothetical protein
MFQPLDSLQRSPSKLLKGIKFYYISYIFLNVNPVTQSLDSSVGRTMSYALDGRGSVPDRGKIFLFSIAFRRALGPIQPPIQWVLRALSPAVNE